MTNMVAFTDAIAGYATPITANIVTVAVSFAAILGVFLTIRYVIRAARSTR